MICHGAPFDEDYYVFGEFDAAEAFCCFQTPICFSVTPTFPFVYSEKDQAVEGTFLEGNSNEVKLEKGVRYLINPGSVGQPRDRNARAACAIYDSVGPNRQILSDRVRRRGGSEEDPRRRSFP